MKISRLETFLFNPGETRNLLFCRIETDAGVHGWGEGYVTASKEKSVDEFIRGMAPALIGRSPFQIRHTSQVLFDDFAIRRNSIGFLSAWAAIEIALWDIVGKVAGLPLYNLMGGASRERIRVYANGWADAPGTWDDNIARAVKVKELGYTALKFDPIPGPWRTFIYKEDEDFAVDYVRKMRDALGPDMEILIEMHRRLAPSYAIRLARRFEEFDIRYYEEPCLSDNVELLAEVRRSIRLPVVTGETLYTKEDFARVFAARAADILNPDICAMGGIGALMDIATMAQPHAVAIAPHNNNSTLAGLAATMHVCAVIPNFLIGECFINRLQSCDEIALQSIKVEAGWAELPTTPGLGIDIDVNKLRKSPYKDTRTAVAATTGRNSRARATPSARPLPAQPVRPRRIRRFRRWHAGAGRDINGRNKNANRKPGGQAPSWSRPTTSRARRANGWTRPATSAPPPSPAPSPAWASVTRTWSAR